MVKSIIEDKDFHAVGFSDKNKNIENNDYEIVGDFKMKGITKEMNIPFTVVSEDGNTIGIRLETSINRIEHNVGSDWVHSAIPNFLANDVPVKIFFWTKRDKRKS